MIYRDFKGTKLSMLGFGTMRLPVLENGQIDAALTQKMVDYAMAHGVNYYDTAWPYMQNRSETVVGQCLKKHPRDSFYLATKFPGHMVAETYDPADIFEQHHQFVKRLLGIVGAAAVDGGDDRLRRLQRKVDRSPFLSAQRMSCSINRSASEDIASVTCAASISELSRTIQPGAGRSGAISRVMS